MSAVDRSSCGVSATTRKRKFQEEGSNGGLRLDELNQDLLERVLSWLPTSTFFRLSSVCKRWKSVAASASFTRACSDVPTRDPWFLMVGPASHKTRPVVLDSTDLTWRQLNHRPAVVDDAIPVASAGGLVCYRGQSGHFTVSNPVTGSTRKIPDIPVNEPLHAIVIQPINHHAFNLILVSGELPFLSFKLFNSKLNQWEDDTSLSRSSSSVNSSSSSDNDGEDENEDENAAVYFLSKAGNVVATDMLRSPTKQYSSVSTVNEEGDNVVHFLSSSGTVVSCNLNQKTFTEHPRLLPLYSEYSVDIIVIGGELVVVVLAEFLETASLRLWRYDDVAKSWCHISAMPPSMSHDFYGKKVDINCVGANNLVLICLNSTDICQYIVYNVVEGEWIELPKCCLGGEDDDEEGMEFMSAFSFEPRIEASVI